MGHFRPGLRSVRPETLCIRLVSIKSTRKRFRTQLMKNNCPKRPKMYLSSTEFSANRKVWGCIASVLSRSSASACEVQGSSPGKPLAKARVHDYFRQSTFASKALEGPGREPQKPRSRQAKVGSVIWRGLGKSGGPRPMLAKVGSVTPPRFPGLWSRYVW